MGIFVILILYGVYNLMSHLRDYQQEYYSRVKQSNKYHRHCARHHMTRLQNYFIHVLKDSIYELKVERVLKLNQYVHNCINKSIHHKHCEMFDKFHIARKTNSDHQVIKKDMEINEHDKLSSIAHKFK